MQSRAKVFKLCRVVGLGKPHHYHNLEKVHSGTKGPKQKYARHTTALLGRKKVVCSA